MDNQLGEELEGEKDNVKVPSFSNIHEVDGRLEHAEVGGRVE